MTAHRLCSYNRPRSDEFHPAFGLAPEPRQPCHSSRWSTDLVHQPVLHALSDRRYFVLFLEVFQERQHLFDGVSTPTLCHEDLNPNNLEFEMGDGRPALTGILDFESACPQHG